MERCWDPDPSKRPLIKEVRKTIGSWYHGNRKDGEFNQAEKKRLESIGLKKIGPEFTETHPKAIYISRPLSSIISKSLSINSSPINSFNIKQGTYYT